MYIYIYIYILSGAEDHHGGTDLRDPEARRREGLLGGARGGLHKQINKEYITMLYINTATHNTHHHKLNHNLSAS